MKRLVLHIGMERTGTSALQRFLTRNRTALRLMGVRYPRPAGKAGSDKHQDLVDALHGGAEAQAAALEALARSRARVTVLSAEKLSAPEPGIAARLAPLRERFDCRVVVYLRRQDEWALSAYRAEVADPARAESREFDDWLADPATRARLDFRFILAQWEQAFGADRLRVLRYPHDLPLVAGFVAAAGLPAAAALLPEGAARVNVGLDDDAFAEAHRRNGGSGRVPVFDQAARDALLAVYREGNEEIRARHVPGARSLFGMR